MNVVFGFGTGVFELFTPKAFGKLAQGNTLGKSRCLDELTLKGFNGFRQDWSNPFRVRSVTGH